MKNREIGMIGEQAASEYLLKNGYHILARNFYTHWGELDIICRKQNTIIFVEVKTRIGVNHGKPFEAVTYGKLTRLLRAIQYYIKGKGLQAKYSLHVVSVTLDQMKQVSDIQQYQDIELPNVYRF